jgi:hypothetical protein
LIVYKYLNEYKYEPDRELAKTASTQRKLETADLDRDDRKIPAGERQR